MRYLILFLLIELVGCASPVEYVLKVPCGVTLSKIQINTTGTSPSDGFIADKLLINLSDNALVAPGFLLADGRYAKADNLKYDINCEFIIVNSVIEIK